MSLCSLSNDKKTTFLFFILITVILGVGYLFFCNPLYYSNLPETIDIGAVLPLTGDLSEYGHHVKDGIDLAVAEVNATGGIHGRELHVWYYDNGGTIQGTLAGFQSARLRGLPVVIGAVSSSNTLAIAPLAEEYQMVLISPSSTVPSLSGYSDWVFRTIASDTYKGRGMIRLVQDLGYNRTNFLVLYQDDDYGKGLYEIMVEAYQEHPSEDLRSYTFLPGESDFSHVNAILHTDVDAVILLGYTAESSRIIEQATQAGITISWFGDESIVNDEFINLTYPASEGIMATLASSHIISSSFEDTFITMYGHNPDTLSAYGYDTMKIVAEAVSIGGYNSPAIRDAIRKIRYLGITGAKSFDKNGDVPPLFDVVRIHNGSWESVSRNELATSFQKEKATTHAM